MKSIFGKNIVTGDGRADENDTVSVREQWWSRRITAREKRS